MSWSITYEHLRELWALYWIFRDKDRARALRHKRALVHVSRKLAAQTDEIRHLQERLEETDRLLRVATTKLRKYEPDKAAAAA